MEQAPGMPAASIVRVVHVPSATCRKRLIAAEVTVLNVWGWHVVCDVRTVGQQAAKTSGATALAEDAPRLRVTHAGRPLAEAADLRRSPSAPRASASPPRAPSGSCRR